MDKYVRYLLVGITFLLTISSCQEKTSLHTVVLETPTELKDYFAYSNQNTPMISGHRGGSKNGYPENSIASMEYTLRHTPATFEIDPRMTKDSVIVLMHDATLDRTTNASGKVSKHTWEQLKQLRLKGPEGKLTQYHIPALEEAIQWAQDKTVLNLDTKGVPKAMYVRKIREHNAESYVIVTVRNARQATYYYKKAPRIMYSAWIKTKEAFREYDKAIPWTQVAQAYIGPEVTPQKQELINLLHGKGVKVMIGAGPSYDKLESEKRGAAYRELIRSGIDIIETDRPVEVAKAKERIEKFNN